MPWAPPGDLLEPPLEDQDQDTEETLCGHCVNTVWTLGENQQRAPIVTPLTGGSVAPAPAPVMSPALVMSPLW